MLLQLCLIIQMFMMPYLYLDKHIGFVNVVFIIFFAGFNKVNCIFLRSSFNNIMIKILKYKKKIFKYEAIVDF